MDIRIEKLPAPPHNDRPTLDWDVIEAARRRARVLRAQAFVRAFGAPTRWLRKRSERLRAPIDFEPIGT